MAKTALQELISKWKSELGSYIPNAPIYKAFIEEAESFLEKEKEQIINAYGQGALDKDIGLNRLDLDYFRETFELGENEKQERC